MSSISETTRTPGILEHTRKTLDIILKALQQAQEHEYGISFTSTELFTLPTITPGYADDINSAPWHDFFRQLGKSAHFSNNEISIIPLDQTDKKLIIDCKDTDLNNGLQNFNDNRGWILPQAHRAILAALAILPSHTYEKVAKGGLHVQDFAGDKQRSSTLAVPAFKYFDPISNYENYLLPIPHSDSWNLTELAKDLIPQDTTMQDPEYFRLTTRHS